MLDVLTRICPWLAAIACGLLLICAGLLFLLLRRQKSLRARMNDQSDRQLRQTQQVAAALEERLRSEIARQQQAGVSSSAENTRALAQHMDALSARMDIFDRTQELRLHRLSSMLDEKLSASDRRSEQLRASLHDGLEQMRQENAEKLEQMRQTVDEKLHETLNKRLGESFSLVNERLEQVYKGLGEMQTLANGVGDLKRVLTNVKTRGIWGEVQLGALLAQMLSPSQYAENVQVVPNSAERVEYAVILPGAEDGRSVYLPIDAKFPVETYARLVSAVEKENAEEISAATGALHAAIRTEARRISQKYIEPPFTTDFAIMFLTTEGLYAEALRCRGLMEEAQRKFRVLIAGPSTLAALLNSLQVGFRTLAIERRSAEVWQLLGAVKTEFGRFSDLLDQTQQRLRQAGETIEKAAVRTRAINRRLRDVEALGTAQSDRLLTSAHNESDA